MGRRTPRQLGDRSDSVPGVIALLPLLDKPMEQVESELGTSVVCHPLGLEAVVDAALDERSSGHRTAKAMAWLDVGFPSVWYRDALRRIIEDGRAGQHDRHVAQKLISRMTS